ncbi:MAG: hypothetical protein LBS52_06035 [Dysgonamonadaceae bacterium]|jgi:hypothetical protein|nr:hypothetical protein [Dysgonamonadaceae bacterium]
MKKKLLFFELIIFTLGFVYSCSADDEPDAYFNRVSISVKSTDWTWVYNKNYANEGYFIATKSVPEITDYIFDYGVVTFYTVFEDGVKSALPYSRTIGYTFDGSTDRGYYTENVSCEFYPGKVSFIIETSDLKETELDLSRVFEIGMVW